MKMIKGFFNIPSLYVNVDGQVSPVGELSPRAKTASRTIAEYKDPAIDLLTLTTFTTKDDSGDYFVLSNGLVNGACTAGNYIVNKILNEGGFGPLNELIEDLESNLGSIGTDWNAGAYVAVGLMNFPSWVSWSTDVGGEVHEFHIWLADEAFRTQYKDFSIVVIPPLSNLDLFFGTYSAVYNLMQARTVNDIFADIRIATETLPYTFSDVRTFDWVNPNNSAQTVPTVWGIVVYGDAGNNDDHIRNAIIEYILANSIYDRPEWRVILPSLFVNTEFIIRPFWDRLSVENMTPEASLYSSIIRPSDIVNYALLAPAGYGAPHITNVAEGSFFTYKTLAFSMFGGSENIDGKVRLSEKFPDYLPINPQVPGFSLMSPATQGWANLINEMLPLAESLSATTPLGPNMSVEIREGISFLASRYNGTLYLIASRTNI